MIKALLRLLAREKKLNVNGYTLVVISFVKIDDFFVTADTTLVVFFVSLDKVLMDNGRLLANIRALPSVIFIYSLYSVGNMKFFVNMVNMFANGFLTNE